MTMLCPNCETENDDGARFCNECGFPLAGSISHAAGSVSPVDEDRRKEAGLSRPTPSWDELWNDWEEKREERENPPSVWSKNVPTRIDADRVAAPPIRNAINWDALSPEAEEADAPYEDIEPDFPDYADDASVDDGYVAAPDAQAPKAGYAFGYERFYRNETAPQAAPFDSGEMAPDDAPALESSFFQRQQPWQMQQDEELYDAWSREISDALNSDSDASKKKAVVVVGALIVLAAVIGIVGYALGLWGGKIVPDVAGMSEPEATATLQEAGFSVRSVQERSDEAEGQVLGTEPGAGAHSPEGSDIALRIAQARTIPEILDKGADEARQLLEEAGYTNVSYETSYSDGEENIVTDVSPEEGTRAKSAMQVIVKVSQNYRVPDVSGMSADEAVQALEDVGLVADVTYIDTDQYPDGTIMNTTPEPGTRVSLGNYVNITVTRTRGIELVDLTEGLLTEGDTVTIAGVDYQIEKVISMSYQGDDTVAFTASAKPYVNLFGETLYASSSQTVSGKVKWTSGNEVESIS